MQCSLMSTRYISPAMGRSLAALRPYPHARSEPRAGDEPVRRVPLGRLDEAPRPGGCEVRQQLTRLFFATLLFLATLLVAAHDALAVMPEVLRQLLDAHHLDPLQSELTG